jgi:hypothetical protein
MFAPITLLVLGTLLAVATISVAVRRVPQTNPYYV